MSDIEEPKISFEASLLSQMKVSATFTQTVEKWEAFIQHAEKTGNTIAKTIAESIKPTIEKIRAMQKELHK